MSHSVETIYDPCTTLTHWGWVTHMCVSKLTTTGSDNGLAPGRRQTIIWTNAGMLLIRPLGTNFSKILIGVQTFSFKKMELKMSSAKWHPFCLGLIEVKCYFDHSCSFQFISAVYSLMILGYKAIKVLMIISWHHWYNFQFIIIWH